ncbi:hypothetical protein SAY87_030934 [Trapa incisa]|uniref:Uncharacterized protein n=1 Tax=Trapa incisa TaxID=236973 RepID=A0AAN7QK80_9MYRT|nr:hypothetical protein SAY87_030934 [Trapa incisa]
MLLAGLKRCGKSCRMRWLKYLKPGIKRGNISQDEEDLIVRMHDLLGNKWSLIAGRLPGRTDNEIKNYWNTRLGKKAKQSVHSPPPPPLSSKGKSALGSPLSTNGYQGLPSSGPAANKVVQPQLAGRTRETKLDAATPATSNLDTDVNRDFWVGPSTPIGSICEILGDSEASTIHHGITHDVQQNQSWDLDAFNFGNGADGRFHEDGGEKGNYLEDLDIDSLTFLFDSDLWTCP